MTRWEAQQAQAKRKGFKNAWAMRKAAASKKRAAERALYGKIKQPHPWKQQQQASMDSCASQKTPGDCEQGNQARRVERLQQGNGPVRQLMRDGEWLVPESERPKPRTQQLLTRCPLSLSFLADGELSAPTSSSLANVIWRANPIESAAGNAEAPVPPHSKRTKPALSPLCQRPALD